MLSVVAVFLVRRGVRRVCGEAPKTQLTNGQEEVRTQWFVAFLTVLVRPIAGFGSNLYQSVEPKTLSAVS